VGRRTAWVFDDDPCRRGGLEPGEDGLDVAHVGAALEQVRGAAVPQRVRMGSWDPGGPRVAAQHEAQRDLAQTLPPPGREEERRPRGSLRPWASSRKPERGTRRPLGRGDPCGLPSRTGFPRGEVEVGASACALPRRRPSASSRMARSRWNGICAVGFHECAAGLGARRGAASWDGQSPRLREQEPWRRGKPKALHAGVMPCEVGQVRRGGRDSERACKERGGALRPGAGPRPSSPLSGSRAGPGRGAPAGGARAKSRGSAAPRGRRQRPRGCARLTTSRRSEISTRV
jgi:hypothetical protein